MNYQVMECRHSYSPYDADVLFATNDRHKAIQAAKDFGSGTVVLEVDEAGNKTRIFTAAFETDLRLSE